MKTTRNALFALLLLGSTAGAASAATSVSAGIHIGPSGRASVDLGFFYDDLATYGNWIERPSYGWVWTPRSVASSWRPYQDGHWVWSDEGWVWVSDEPYGWATYHYGRWYDDPEIGWAWVPGTEWGPAWVSWQQSDDYYGWAPLPPRVDVSVSYGRGYGDYAYGIEPEHYVFVPARHILAPRVVTYFVSRPRVYDVYRETRNCTVYRRDGGRYYNQGIPIDRVQRFGRVPRYQVADFRADFRDVRQRRSRIEGQRIAVFRPEVQRVNRIAPPNARPQARRAVVSAPQFKAAHRERIQRQAVQRQTERAQRQSLRQRQQAVQQREVRANQRERAAQQQQERLRERQQDNRQKQQRARQQERAAQQQQDRLRERQQVNREKQQQARQQANRQQQDRLRERQQVNQQRQAQARQRERAAQQQQDRLRERQQDNRQQQQRARQQERQAQQQQQRLRQREASQRQKAQAARQGERGQQRQKPERQRENRRQRPEPPPHH